MEGSRHLCTAVEKIVVAAAATVVAVAVAAVVATEAAVEVVVVEATVVVDLPRFHARDVAFYKSSPFVPLATNETWGKSAISLLIPAICLLVTLILYPVSFSKEIAQGKEGNFVVRVNPDQGEEIIG